jgi:hypothetical protein
MKQLEMITVASPAATGSASMEPRRNSTLATLSRARCVLARASRADVVTTPMMRPRGPTSRAAIKQSIPPPLPRSTTTSPLCKPARPMGSPQPSESAAMSNGKLSARPAG